MLPAVDSFGKRIAPIKGGRGICPGCGGEMIAKCGDTNAHHWAHRRGEDCDTWREPMTDWHLAWQECFPEECREVWVGPNMEHRADVKGQRKILEVQKSPISAAEIEEREEFYGDMAWMLCGEDFEGRFMMWTCDDEKRICFRFKWKSMRRCWLAARKDIYIHFSKGVAKVLELGDSGEGVLEFIGIDEFRNAFDDRFDPTSIHQSGKKFAPLIPGFAEKCLECFRAIRGVMFSDSDFYFHNSIPGLQRQREICAYISRYRDDQIIVDLLNHELPPIDSDWFHQACMGVKHVTTLPAELFRRHRSVDTVQKHQDTAILVWKSRQESLQKWKLFSVSVQQAQRRVGRSFSSIGQDLYDEMISVKKQRMLCSYVKMQPIVVAKFLDFVPQLLAPEFEKYIFHAVRSPDFPHNPSDPFALYMDPQPSRGQVKELLALMPRDYRDRIKRSVAHMDSVAVGEEQRRIEEEAERQARDREAREKALRERLSWPIEEICGHLSEHFGGASTKNVPLAQHVAMFSESIWSGRVSGFELAVAKESLEKFNPLSVWNS